MRMLILVLFSITSLALGQVKELELPKRTINLDVAGLLQMGLSLQAEYRIPTTKVYVAPYVRYPITGLIYQMYTSDQFRLLTSPVTLGAGFLLKSFRSTQAGAWYWAIGCDYSFGQIKNKDNSWQRDFQYLWPMATLGARWRHLEKRNIVSIGIMVGPYLAIKDQSYYKIVPDYKFKERFSLYMAAVEVSFGLEKR
jgi:hypothetical protein